MTGPDGPDNGSPGSDLILSGARDRIPAPAQSEDGARQWSITRAEHQETSNFYFPPQKYLIKTFDPETSVILHTVTPPPPTIFQSKLLTKVHKKYFNLHIEHEHQTIVNSLKIYQSNYDPFYNIIESLHTFKCQSC